MEPITIQLPLMSGPSDAFSVSCCGELRYSQVISYIIIFYPPVVLVLVQRWFVLGTNDVDQLQKVFHILGTPKPEDWPGVELLPKYVEFQHSEAVSLIPLFRQPSPDQMTNGIPSSLDLLLNLLSLNPSKRISASEVSVKITAL